MALERFSGDNGISQAAIGNLIGRRRTMRMKPMSDRIANMLRQAYPRVYDGTTEDIAEKCLFETFWRCGFELPEFFLKYGEEINIEFVERVYEKGYSAIINDGKLLGFRKENAL